MARGDDGQMRRAELDKCLVGCNLDSTLRYIDPSVAVVRTTSRSSHPTRVCYLVPVSYSSVRLWPPPRLHTVACSANTYARYAFRA